MGIDVPTDAEKDPAFLALQVRALRQAFESLSKANKENLLEIQRAFSMSDIHQQILGRIVRDLTRSVANLQGFLVLDRANGIDLTLKLKDGVLDVPAYYAEFREVVQTAGEKLGDTAAIFWSQGASPTEAVERAKLRVQENNDPVEETNYEIEYFGGTNGKGSDQQVAQGAQEAG